MTSRLTTLALLSAAFCAGAQTPAKPATCSIVAQERTDRSRALDAENFATAEAFYTQQVSSTPTDSAWAGLVHAQIGLNKVDAALASAAKAAGAFPKSATAQSLVGDAQLRAGNFDEAMAAYTLARTLDPCSAAAHFGTGRILLLLSMRASALKELALAHRLMPGDVAIGEKLFALLTPDLHAKGLRNLLISAQDITAAHRQRLEQQAALLEGGALCQASPITAPTRVDLQSLFYNGNARRDFAIRIDLPEKRSLTLDFDSTAHGIVLSAKDAAKLNVTPAVAGQQTPPYLGYFDGVQIGSLHFGKCAVSVVPDAALANNYSVIGTDFFRDALIHIDWNAKQMTLSPYPAAEGSSASALTNATVPETEKRWSRVYVDDQRLLARSLLNKKPAGLFMLDTSYSLNVVSPAQAARMHSAQKDDTVDLYGTDGELIRIFIKTGGSEINRSEIRDPNGKYVVVRHVDHDILLQFVGVVHEVRELFSIPMDFASHAADIEISGLVTFGIMEQYFIDIDYRDGLVNLNYDVSAAGRPRA